MLLKEIQVLSALVECNDFENLNNDIGKLLFRDFLVHFCGGRVDKDGRMVAMCTV